MKYRAVITRQEGTFSYIAITNSYRGKYRILR